MRNPFTKLFGSLSYFVSIDGRNALGLSPSSEKGDDSRTSRTTASRNRIGLLTLKIKCAYVAVRTLSRIMHHDCVVVYLVTNKITNSNYEKQCNGLTVFAIVALKVVCIIISTCRSDLT